MYPIASKQVKLEDCVMEPTLKDGDRILVNKVIKGARLFDVFAVLRNDILVFNFPYQMNRWDSVRFDVMQYYVKRCIALPGDTLEIRGGFYKIRGCDEQLGNYSAQHGLANLDHPEWYGIVVGTFPYDKQIGWTIREFGPLPIPKRFPCLAPLRAYVKAWNTKIIPIFLTVASTVLGFIPFMVGAEKEGFWFPLAAGTIGGLIMSVVGVFVFCPY
ncbi:hypothetical protein KUBF_22320 [Bacteroides finegoldii]|nr:hypothetical protein KUBF_22320 [Bacteroides finegoldii]